MAQEFMTEYKSVLKQLVKPEKPQINMLTMLAEDNRTYAQHIVIAIEHHLQQCTPPARLSALYLVDSIIKNVKEPYTSMFCKRLDQVFGKVWDTTPAAHRTPLTKLVNTWGPVLPADVVARVQARMTGGAQQQAQQQQQHHVQIQQQQVLQAIPAPQQQQQLVQQVFQHPPPQLVPAPGMVGAPISLQLQPGQQLVGGPGGVQLINIQQPQQQQPPLFVMGPHGHLVPVAQQQQPAHQIILQQPPPPHAIPQHMVVGGLPPVSPAHPGWAQQQQQVVPAPRPMMQQQPMVRRSPGYPASPALGGASPHHTSSRSPHHQHNHPHGSAPGSSVRSGSPGAAADLSASLNTLLQGLTRTGYLNDPALKTTTFEPAFLKKEHKGAIALLKAASDGTRKRFKDVQYQRNKRRRDAAASASLLSRAWYLPVDAWITGTTLLTDAADAVAAEEAEEEDEGPAAVPTVDKDPSQTHCAISHEPFEEVFDTDRDTWVYRGVVRLQGSEAQRYGVEEGSIVKVECLTEADLGSSPAALAAAAAAGEAAAGGGGGGGGGGGEDEADLAAAAAAAPAAGQQQEQQQRSVSPSPAAAGAAAGAVAAAAASDEHKPAVHVKMEQDGEDTAVGLKLDTTATVAAAAAADGIKQQQQQDDDVSMSAAAAVGGGVGVKREAADSQQQLQQQEGTPSKKLRVSPEP